ncbi:hypothetical protein T265_06901 [Opisthorchis viverrini]|uniref:Uncharacterized protein n=1 Tax=Opisthorchis viverrini TaxID=6198 RepID=A0A075ACW7_OPIVI|nr:hypothetical protein T265_06901 [Opisthorchis viverrini]KER25664.1 hypothetical protein T265_06901 [Opisthorchis viverrini]
MDLKHPPASCCLQTNVTNKQFYADPSGDYPPMTDVTAEHIERLSVLDHRCLQSIALIQWEHRISNAEVRRVALVLQCAPYASQLTSSKGSFRSTIRRVEMSKGCSNNDLTVMYGSCYQKTHFRLSLLSSWFGTPSRNTSMIGDFFRHGPVAPSMALVHPSHCFQFMASLPISSIKSPVTTLYLCINCISFRLQYTAIYLPLQIISERNCGSYNHCTTNMWFLQLLMIMSVGSSLLSRLNSKLPWILPEQMVNVRKQRNNEDKAAKMVGGTQRSHGILQLHSHGRRKIAHSILDTERVVKKAV